MSTEFRVLLPNLRYQNNDIYFISHRPIKLKKNGKNYFQTEFPLGFKKRFSSIKYKGVQYECTIIEKEEEDGLIVSVKYETNYDNNYCHDTFKMKKLAKLFESYILNIRSYSDNDDRDDDLEISEYCQKEIKKNSLSSSSYDNDDYDNNNNNNDYHNDYQNDYHNDKYYRNKQNNDEEFNGYLFEVGNKF